MLVILQIDDALRHRSHDWIMLRSVVIRRGGSQFTKATVGNEDVVEVDCGNKGGTDASTIKASINQR